MSEPTAVIKQDERTIIYIVEFMEREFSERRMFVYYGAQRAVLSDALKIANESGSYVAVYRVPTESGKNLQRIAHFALNMPV